MASMQEGTAPADTREGVACAAAIDGVVSADTREGADVVS